MLAVAEVTTAWADVVEARLRSRGADATSGAIDSEYIAGMLAMTGRILDSKMHTDVQGSAATVLSLALTAAGPEADETADWSEKWRRLRGLSTTPSRGREIRGTAQQSLLQRLGRTQGRGESIVGIDAAEVMDELERVSIDWRPPSPGQDSAAEHLRWYEGVAGLLDDAVTAETKRLADWTERFYTNIESDSDNPLEAAVVEVEAVLGEVARLGKGASSDARLRRAIEKVGEVDTGVLSELLAFYGRRRHPGVVPTAPGFSCKGLVERDPTSHCAN